MAPPCSTTNSRLVSAGGAVTNTGLERLPLSSSSAGDPAGATGPFEHAVATSAAANPLICGLAPVIATSP